MLPPPYSRIDEIIFTAIQTTYRQWTLVRSYCQSGLVDCDGRCQVRCLCMYPRRDVVYHVARC